MKRQPGHTVNLANEKGIYIAKSIMLLALLEY